MKATRIFISSLLVVIVTMLLSGCGTQSLTEDVKESEKIVSSILNTISYDPPTGYTAYYENENREKLVIKHNNTKIVYDVLEHESKLSLISTKDIEITQELLETANQLVYDLLNTKAFVLPSNPNYRFRVRYRENTKHLVDVSIISKDKHIGITITYDTAQTSMQMSEITYYNNENFFLLMVTLFIFIIISACCIILNTARK